MTKSKVEAFSGAHAVASRDIEGGAGGKQLSRERELVRLEGQVLDDRYRLDGCLAHPEGIALFRATDQKTGHTVLIEVVAPPDSPPPAGVPRARRHVAPTPDDPRIVPELDLGATESGLRYVVMEYVDGESLAARLSRLKRIRPPDAAEIVALVAEALEALHAQAVAHANLHPARVFVTGEGSRLRVRLVRGLPQPRRIDVCGKDDETKLLMQAHADVRWFDAARRVLGPIDYASPEELVGNATDPKSDVYSLGALLYHLVTGSPPFEGPPERIVAQHIAAPPMPIDLKRVPHTLAAELRRALAKQPIHRHASAGDLATALRQAVNTSTTSPPPSMHEAPTAPPPAGFDIDAAISEYLSRSRRPGSEPRFAKSEPPTEPSTPSKVAASPPPAAPAEPQDLGELGSHRLVGRIDSDDFLRIWRSSEKNILVQLAPDLAADADLSTAFLRDAEALAQTDHPALVRVIDWVIEGDTAFLLLDSAEGWTLDAVITAARAKNQPISQQVAVPIALDILDAIEAVDANGAAFGDLNPRSVIITSSGDARVIPTCIGGASRAQMPRAHSGRLAFRAPEQLGGTHANALSDQYALGAILFWILFGRPPFDASTADDLVDLVREGPKPALRTERFDLPPGLIDAVERMLARDPGERFASLDEARKALTAVAPAAIRAPLLKLASNAREPDDLESRWALPSVKPSVEAAPPAPQPQPEAPAPELPPITSTVRTSPVPPPPPAMSVTDTQRIVPKTARLSAPRGIQSSTKTLPHRIELPASARQRPRSDSPEALDSAWDEDVEPPDRAQDYVPPHLPPSPLKSAVTEPAVVDQTEDERPALLTRRKSLDDDQDQKQTRRIRTPADNRSTGDPLGSFARADTMPLPLSKLRLPASSQKTQPSKRRALLTAAGAQQPGQAGAAIGYAAEPVEMPVRRSRLLPISVFVVLIMCLVMIVVGIMHRTPSVDSTDPTVNSNH